MDGQEKIDEQQEFQIDPRLKARQAPFMFTKPSREERQWKRKRLRSWIILILYNIITLLLTWFYLLNDDESEEESGTKFEVGSLALRPKHAIIYALALSFNLLIIFPSGYLAIRAIVFPFSFWASRSLITGSNSI